MSDANAPSSTASPQGRRVLVAVVTGAPGEAIQRWREEHDPEQARRLPPHTTLCYWAPAVPLDAFEQQVRYAFAEPVTVELGDVHVFDNEQETFYVEVRDTEGLDAARRRLYDGTHAALPGFNEWTWHVTCVRESRGRDRAALEECARLLDVRGPWPVDTVALMELRGDSYATIARWELDR